MKLAITNEEEIMSLFDILNEIQSVYEYQKDILELDKKDYPILSKLDNSDYEYFLDGLMQHLSGIHFQRILWNLLTLLDNCADKSKDYLDFNPDIKKGLELLEETKKEKL